MADTKAKKVNKNPKNIKTDVVLIVVVLILIAVYIFVEAYSVTHVDVETITAVTSTVYETIDAKAIVIRDEHTIDSSNGSVTVACVDDADKVKVNGNIAMQFASAEAAKAYSTSLALRQELDYYINLESKAAGMATDVASIDKDILGDVNDYIRKASNYKAGALSDSSLDLNDKLTRRQMIIGENIDFSSVKGDLQAQLNEIDISSCKPTGYVKAPESGIFSSYTDGLETAFDYKNVAKMDTDTFDSYMKQASSAQTTNSLGKLITNYDWYFCCKVSTSEIKGIQDGDTLSVALKNSDQVIECEVVSGATVDLGVEESVLVLRSSQMNSQIASMRVEDIEIRYNEYTGFKVPSSAIHIDKDGNKIVYALVANQVSARQGEIIYSTKDFAIFRYNPEGDNPIRLYDQIITQGKDLHDGKVYT